MALVKIVNATAVELEDVDATDQHVPPYSVSPALELTAAELDTLLHNDGVVALGEGSTDEQRRLAAKILKLGKQPGVATTDDSN